MHAYSPRHSAAYELDAADGVIDGKAFGRPIVQVPAGGRNFIQQPTQILGGNALALDAADGVIDGAFHGRPIIQQGPAFQTTAVAPRMARTVVAAQREGEMVTMPRQYNVPHLHNLTQPGTDPSFYPIAHVEGGTASRVDGRVVSEHWEPGYAPNFFPAPRSLARVQSQPVIVQQPAPVVVQQPAPVRVVHQPQVQQRVVRTHVQRHPSGTGAHLLGEQQIIGGGQQIIAGGGQQIVTGGQQVYRGGAPNIMPLNRALALDAADGVIDGKINGVPIMPVDNHMGFASSGVVNGGFVNGRPMTAAERLDAADGVMDGAFNGRPIVDLGGAGNLGAVGGGVRHSAASRAAALDAADGM